MTDQQWRMLWFSNRYQQWPYAWYMFPWWVPFLIDECQCSETRPVGSSVFERHWPVPLATWVSQGPLASQTSPGSSNLRSILDGKKMVDFSHNGVEMVDVAGKLLVWPQELIKSIVEPSNFLVRAFQKSGLSNRFTRCRSSAIFSPAVSCSSQQRNPGPSFSI